MKRRTPTTKSGTVLPSGWPSKSDTFVLKGARTLQQQNGPPLPVDFEIRIDGALVIEMLYKANQNKQCRSRDGATTAIITKRHGWSTS